MLGAKWREAVVAVKMFKIEGMNEAHIRDFLSECHAMEVGDINMNIIRP